MVPEFEEGKQGESETLSHFVTARIDDTSVFNLRFVIVLSYRYYVYAINMFTPLTFSNVRFFLHDD